MKKKRLAQSLFLLLLIVGTVWIVSSQRSIPYQHDEGFVFGTIYHVTYQSENNMKPAIEAEMKKVDQALSTFNKTSDISLVNQNKPVTLSKMFVDVFQLAQSISKETEGAFDITVAPLVNLWGFGFKQGQEPTKASLDSIRALVGWQKVSLANGRVEKSDPRIMLDCSAIAKGYGADVVANYLKSQGVKNFLVEIRGEIVSSGLSEKRVPWMIGVTKPTDDSLQTNKELQTVLNVNDLAMATSGNYRNFYYKDGKKYAHTVDPKTGRPVQHSLLSATVLAKDCATADAYATAFMVMGMEHAKLLLEKHPELMAYFIYDEGRGENKVWCSEAMKDKIVE